MRVCVLFVTSVKELLRGGGSLRSFQRLMCEIISREQPTILIGSEAQKPAPTKQLLRESSSRGGLAL